jgi:hypothetical protein
MQNIRRIPRWLVENDPTWEKSIDPDLNNLKWTKKGTNIKAISSATSMFCDIVGEPKENGVGLIDISANFINNRNSDTRDVHDITKYLSSRYLNPGINSSLRPDIGKHNFYKMPWF